LDRIRDMTKFDSVDQLVEQLKADEEVTRNWS
ncbi:TPA: bifunctional riboflavin kinase/FAD synthetase, partial [Streptococcus pneumoniae]|nr:bifunctional riboflavin kinase/FAD synthetase [Streptococcus pneumoniae]